MQDDLMLYRRDPPRNMARFYALHLQPTLFGDIALTRCWGRIGTWGRAVVELHPDRETAETALMAIAEQKRRRGYR